MVKWEFSANLLDGVFDDYEEMNVTAIKFSKEVIENKEIKFVTYKEVLYQGCTFENVCFNNDFLGKVKFQNCEFMNVSFLESSFSKVVFSNCKFTNVSFFEMKVDNGLFLECKVQLSKIENSEILNSKFDDVSFTENIHRHNKYNFIDFYKCDFEGENFIDTIFRECDLKTSDFKEVRINIDDLISSTLSMLNVIQILAYKGIIISE